MYRRVRHERPSGCAGETPTACQSRNSQSCSAARTTKATHRRKIIGSKGSLSHTRRECKWQAPFLLHFRRKIISGWAGPVRNGLRLVRPPGRAEPKATRSQACAQFRRQRRACLPRPQNEASGQDGGIPGLWRALPVCGTPRHGNCANRRKLSEKVEAEPGVEPRSTDLQSAA